MTRRWVFAPDQAAELRTHLLVVIPEFDAGGADVDAAVAAIDFAAAPCTSGMTPGEWRLLCKANHDHMGAVRDAAGALRALLNADRADGQDSRPVWKTSAIDWSAFDSTLATIAESAASEAETFRPQVGGGRAPDEWRDKLIATIHSVYPPGVARRYVGSHFEDTVTMVLGYIGREVENVHGLIIDALRRQPAAPFIARTTAKRAVK